MDDLALLDAVGQADLVRHNELRPIDLVDAAIARIERVNPVLNAVTIQLFEKAREQALSPLLPDGPFCGVPLLLKDFHCHTAGDPYYEGTRFLKELDWREGHDTYLAAKFRSAGFVFLGKTNLPELAAGVGANAGVHGVTNNPWDVTRSPGGSSSGSCAAVASGLVPVAHANDGTGSIRLPASACGLVGLKPSRGRISTGPANPGVLGNMVEHVATRTVRDTAAVLDVISGPMPGDLYVAPRPTRPYIEEIGQEPGHLRVGVLAEDVFLRQPVHPECTAAVQRTGKLLEEMGHEVVESYPPAIVGPSGLGLPLRIVSASKLAAHLDTWGARLGRPLGEDDVSPQVWEMAQLGRTFTAVQLQWAVARLAAGAMRSPEWWASGFDLLVTPTVQQPPPRWDEVRPEDEGATWGLFTMPFSVSGQPAISLPLHWTPDGLPIGVQLVADYGREDLLIRVASQLEKATQWYKRRPPIFASSA